MPLQNILDAKKDIPRDLVYKKFGIDRPGKIIFVGHHLSTKTTVRCLIRKISLQGAELEVSRMLPVPKNFFLEILGIRDEIGCTLMRREQETAVVSFNMLIDPEFLHHVVKLSFEFGP
ncbi:hypothetical protein FS827_01470 [Agrobacterium vitis]|uniref:PilZ domain-containing protein n=2 Tax=Rhizobium/Agrobacterium group TaxID=227290 RepID=B9JUM2_ALLAM|nr:MULTISPECIES: hypothetical protein [Rhizobium/Agrobacterium group]ACM36017.1 Conserved hypothetical protein [Allorhizobium ampelinum S4]MBF2716660.1 hypothetical protein [Agrobacterium vitis]MCF1448184.1 hypothetical protein [Allorhizobium ampelinum]MCF1459979.1 hypothetical protein [Allorhizobium ampelinum]MCF1472810.1 hypothetical protein [Allorhizobium ampelinum]